MKANFKIENDDSDKKETDESKNKKNTENIGELPKGGNLWSIRSKGNK